MDNKGVSAVFAIIFFIIAIALAGLWIDSDKNENPEAETQVMEEKPRETSKEQATITYTVQSTQILTNTIVTLELTKYVKGDKSRFDTEYQNNSIRVYILGEKTISCTQTNEWTCINTPSPIIQNLIQTLKTSLNHTVSKTENKNIAGNTAHCYEIKSDQETQNNCYTQNLLVYSKVTTPTYTLTQSASKYKTRVDNTIFDLPEQIQNTPN